MTSDLRESHLRNYQSLDPEKRQQCLDWLRTYLDETRYTDDPSNGGFAGLSLSAAIRRMHAEREDWYAPIHFFMGMSLRNTLRKNGFGEAFWPVTNLDDYYVPLIEAALRIGDYA